MGAYENPGQFQIYDPTGDIMIAQAFAKFGTDIVSAFAKRQKEQKEMIFKNFELDEASLKQLNKKQEVVLNAAPDYGLDVNSIKNYVGGLKDEAFKYEQEINKLKVKGVMPSKELLEKRDKANATLTTGVASAFNTIKEVSDLAGKVNFGSIGTEGNVSATTDPEALRYLKNFNVNGEGNKISFEPVLDSSGNTTLGIKNKQSEVGTVFGLQEALSKVNRIVPEVTKQVTNSKLFTDQQSFLQNMFTKQGIQAAKQADPKNWKTTYKALGTFIPKKKGDRVYEAFIPNLNLILQNEGVKNTLTNVGKELLTEYSDEQIADIYNNVYYTTRRVNGKLERINTSTEAPASGTSNIDTSLIDFSDEVTTNMEQELFINRTIQHFNKSLVGAIDDKNAVIFDDEGKLIPKEVKADTEDGKVTPIDIVNFTEIAIKPLQKDVGGKVAPEALGTYLELAQSMSNNKFKVVKTGDVETYVLENTTVNPNNGDEATGADAVPILDYWTKRTKANLGKNNYPEKDASEQEIIEYATNKALEPTRKKLGAGTYDFDYYKIVGRTPVKFLDYELNRLQTNEGRYNFWRDNVMSETDAKRKELKALEPIIKMLDKYERGEELTELQMRAIQPYLNTNTK